MTDAPASHPALADHQRRLAGTRTAARRLVARAQARRRLLPPLVVGSGAILGSSVLGAWILGQQPPTVRPAATPTAPSSSGDTELSADIAALQGLAQTLAADRTAISALQPAGAAASGTSGGPGVFLPQGSGPVASGAVSSGPRPSAASPASAPAVPTAPSVPALPTLPTLPAVTVPPPAPPPPVHTTTGATAVAP
ncbi:MAG TPA: hypothetical protein VKU86_02740 [Acidimicrobiales bacterium]|nr:hypothetical protein [Acidimicrobiales bacterium]